MTEPAQIPAGVIAVTTYGVIQAETTQALVLLGRQTNAEIRLVPGNLVDKARNEAVRQMLATPTNQWLWFLDADMIWRQDLAPTLLTTAFLDETTKNFDIVGGYCQLRGGESSPYLPTIDTGTGTWEPHDAGIGPLEVIRTGAACLLIKRHVFERMQFPWFGVRPASSPLEMMAEVDNFARIKFDGENPFWGENWEKLLKCAEDETVALRSRQGGDATNYTYVGEDSNFCDKARALGFRILVQTNAICGHIDHKVIEPKDHTEAMKRNYDKWAWACGIEK